MKVYDVYEPFQDVLGMVGESCQIVDSQELYEVMSIEDLYSDKADWEDVLAIDEERLARAQLAGDKKAIASAKEDIKYDRKHIGHIKNLIINKKIMMQTTSKEVSAVA